MADKVDGWLDEVDNDTLLRKTFIRVARRPPSIMDSDRLTDLIQYWDKIPEEELDQMIKKAKG